MELLKPCQICRHSIAKYKCRACGSSVCEMCIVKNKNICINCSIGRA